MRRYLLASLWLLIIVFAASGQTISYTVVGSNYTQNFNALPNSGTYTFTANGPLEISVANGFGGNVNGWYVERYAGSSPNLAWAFNNGASNTGAAYSYGTTGSTDRALGSLSSGTKINRFGALVTNNTGGPINQITISFYTEMWRRGDLAIGNITNFEYKVGATAINDASGFVAVPSLNLVTPNLSASINTATDGNNSANRTLVTYILTGIFINSGETLAIRWSDPNDLGADDGLAIDDFTFTGNLVAASTDYFRSVQTGNWNDIATWESSSDNSNWIPATSTPASTANTITIRNGHTVTLVSSVSADQVVIESGGVLVNQMPASNTFTITEDAGDDLEIQNGGMYHILSEQGYSNYQAINPGATIRIRSGGTIRLGNGLVFGGSENYRLAATSASYIWENSAVFEWNSAGSFSSDGVIYFPDVDATTIPIFKTLVNMGMVGASANTTFNGIFEANGNVVFQGSGTKIFRNGIRGSGNIDGVNGTTLSGTFIINGTTAELGGTGSLIAPSTGLEIGSASGTTVTVTSNKTVTGDISLLSTNTFLELGSNNLTVTGNITGGGHNAYIRTNGTGVLRLNTVDAAGKIFPIGNTSYNPLVISNGSNADYSARVITGIVPLPAFPTFGVNRTWEINASTPTSGVNVNFQYALSDVNAGALPQPQNMEILLYSGSAWSIIPGNGSIFPSGTDPYTITTAATLTISDSPVPYALGKSGGYILPIDFFITARSEKRDNDGIIGWNVFETANVRSFEVQRSMNNGDYKTIATVFPTVNQLAYNYTDINIPAGTNLYRIKVNRISGAVRYSNTVAIINDSKGLLITSVFPNPVSNTATITLSVARSGMADIQLYDISGTLVYRRRSAIAEGTNYLPVEMGKFSAGVYHLAVQSADSKAVYRLVKQ